MKTGILILAQSSKNQAVAEAVADELKKRGRRNVRIGYHFSSPRSDDVMVDMFESDGVDTFCILPLCMAEGRMTVWKMPNQLGLPDNSGSWRMIGEHDVATRFACAVGFDERLADAIVRELGEPSEGTGVLVLARGSSLSMASKVANRYASYIREHGWRTAYSFTDAGEPTVEGSLIGLSDCRRIVSVPLMIGTDREGYAAAVEKIGGSGAEVVETRPVSSYPEFIDNLDSRIPEDW